MITVSVGCSLLAVDTTHCRLSYTRDSGDRKFGEHFPVSELPNQRLQGDEDGWLTVWLEQFIADTGEGDNSLVWNQENKAAVRLTSAFLAQDQNGLLITKVSE